MRDFEDKEEDMTLLLESEDNALNGVGLSHSFSLFSVEVWVNGVLEANVVFAEEMDGVLRIFVDRRSGASHSSVSNPMPLRCGVSDILFLDKFG